MTIICADGDDRTKLSVERIYINPEYGDEAVSLTDIEKRYPRVIKVIYDELMKGYIYDYGNHRNESEMWELVGETIGYV